MGFQKGIATVFAQSGRSGETGSSQAAKQFDLFDFEEAVGQVYHKGWTIFQALQDYVRTKL